MIELELTLRTEAPLVLRANRTSTQFTPTLTYIPGVTLRGALALDYLRQGGQPNDELFRRIFLSGAVSFGPLFPSANGGSGRPLPLSAVACKRYGAKHSKSVGDSLLRLELADILQSLKPVRDWETCPDCQARNPNSPPNKRDRLTGYYLEQDEFATVKPAVRMLTGVGMSRATGTAAQGILFSMEGIEEDQCFKGRVHFYGEEAGGLAEQLKGLAPEESILRLGAARSRGQGRVRVVGWRDVNQAGPSLAERWDALNEVVRRLWAKYDAEPEGEYFTLTLESPLILQDGCLRPLRPDGLVAASFGLPAGVERRRVMLNEVLLQGWNAAWRLPKRDTPAFGIGSVFLFRVPAGRRDGVLSRLAEIERTGLGEQRNAGFGWVRVCDPFHYRFEEVSG
jgi:CRISPR-associated protein Csx10